MSRAWRLVLLALAACDRQPTTASGEFIGPTWPARKILGEPTPAQIAQLQLFVIPFHRKVRAVPGFSELYIEHEPRWRVVVAFTRPPPRNEIVRLAHDVLRDRIEIRTAKRTSVQIASDMDRLATALRGAGFDWTGFYDPKRQRFEVTVARPEHAVRARAALPADLSVDSDIRV